jgi:hypothetical protein
MRSSGLRPLRKNCAMSVGINAIAAERLSAQTRARSTGDFEVICLFAAAGLIVTVLVFGLIGFDELGRVLALAG